MYGNGATILFFKVLGLAYVQMLIDGLTIFLRYSAPAVGSACRYSTIEKTDFLKDSL